MSHCLLMPLQNLLVAQKLSLAHHLVIDALFFTMIYRRRRTQNTGSYNICTLSQNAAMTSFTPFHSLVFFAISFPSGFPDCTVSCLFIVSISLIVSFGRRQKILYLNAACKVFQVKGTLADFCTKRNLIDVRWRLVQLETIILTMTR
jgi:hypothetical protein